MGHVSGVRLALDRLVAWSSARACGLPPPGRLVVGSVVDLSHCWVEFPSLGIGTDPVARLLWHNLGRPVELHAWLRVRPPTRRGRMQVEHGH
ncbi:hypothetical protein [Enhygromyxa salina]|uniref:hypothetical protein n=1 Tax=Enhygromyxa salina TaxID=215803 RepID=UPI000D08AB9F|nr:hypothetical protein [Enhygromyxa salina]